MADLSRLQLQFNSLTSTIPDGLFANTGLVELRLDYNKLSGSIPSLIGNLVELVDLRLAGNAFTSTLPEELSRLSALGTHTTVPLMILGVRNLTLNRTPSFAQRFCG
jgi:Leucine-rich repeat (LRR) protein